MARVQVYVPWHVALLDTLSAWLPRSRPVRALAGAAALAVLAAVTLVSLWLVTRVNEILFAVDLGFARVRGAVAGWVTDLLAGALGEPAMVALRQAGWLGMIGALAALLVATAAAASLLRGLARSRGR
jgi:hypothetical protein